MQLQLSGCRRRQACTRETRDAQRQREQLHASPGSQQECDRLLRREVRPRKPHTCVARSGHSSSSRRIAASCSRPAALYNVMPRPPSTKASCSGPCHSSSEAMARVWPARDAR
eukprot:362560-Chlamydomonas_euryale.AAC.7